MADQALGRTAPNLFTAEYLADPMQIANGGGSTTGGVTLATEGVVDASGAFTLHAADSPIWTSDGTFENFERIAFYNLTAAGSPLLAACAITHTSMSAAGNTLQFRFPSGLVTHTATGAP